jgi:hypothetical protein
MAYETEKAKLYQRIEQLTGISRKIDPRLEKIAEDRALEARFQVGTTGATPISHPLDQLKARTWPLQGTFKGVWENATWHYYPPVWVDPIDALIDAMLPDGTKVGWWNSQAHKDNLLNVDATTQGIGLFKVHIAPTMADRWYAIHIFTKDLNMDVVVVNGKNFPDALAAGPFAASLGAPILLVEPTRIPASTMTYLQETVIARIFIIGGEGAVSSGVASLLAGQANQTIRISGADRYETAVAVARSDG